MNLFEERILKFNNQRKAIKKYRCLKPGEAIENQDNERERYEAYMKFAIANKDKIGTTSLEDASTHPNKDSAKTRIVYTEYGPLISRNSDDKFTHYEGIFKFNVDNEEKLLYIRTTGNGLDYCDFLSSPVVVRREDGSFELCNWSSENRLDIASSDYHKYGPTQISNLLILKDYFNEQKTLLEEKQQ